MLTWKNANLESAKLEDANLEGANLGGANLGGRVLPALDIGIPSPTHTGINRIYMIYGIYRIYRIYIYIYTHMIMLRTCIHCRRQKIATGSAQTDPLPLNSHPSHGILCDSC